MCGTYLEFLDERPSADIVDCSINTVLPLSFRRHIKTPTRVNTSRASCRAECSRYTYTSIQMHACIYKHTQYTHKHKNNLSHKHTHNYEHACINIKENLQKKKVPLLNQLFASCWTQSLWYAILCYYICFMCTPLYFSKLYTILWNVLCFFYITL